MGSTFSRLIVMRIPGLLEVKILNFTEKTSVQKKHSLVKTLISIIEKKRQISTEFLIECLLTICQ